jgi:HEPN domain-containing protein
MSGDDASERRREAASWLAIAREDVRVARGCMSLNPPAYGVAAYHCQQAAEKLVKGLLVAASTPFRKTHDMDELADLAGSIYPDARDLLDTVRMLTRINGRDPPPRRDPRRRCGGIFAPDGGGRGRHARTFESAASRAP